MNNYKLNRLGVYEQLEDNSVLILYSGALKQMSADENYPFFVNTNFYYLTGIDQDNTYLVVTKIKGEIKEIIYAYENTEYHSKWMGDWLFPEEIFDLSDVDELRFVDKFEDDLKALLKKNSQIKKVYLDLEKPQFDGQVNFGFVLKDKVNAISFDKKVLDAYPIITKTRGCKKPYEIETFRKADEITKQALEEVMKVLPTLKTENQVQAKFEQEIKHIANCGVSFETIAAAGKNAATLHYRANNDTLEGKNMILLDLGALYGKYHADISRTYPINGKYGELELKIYNIVLGCNKYIISQIRPGIGIKELQQMTIDYLAEGCLKAGLIKDKEEIHNYYFHGVSHHIGLDTHDPYPRYTTLLEPGMIISCEPGLYFKELGIGVRIEDDILVTEDGRENLSKDIIKEPDEIEAFMAKYNK
jgi:Xaa-Pro aminopeptidase